MSESDPYVLKYQQLLRDLKNTVEGLLVSQVANVWSIYGGLNRLHCSVDKIFKHGCKSPGIENTSYFNFIQGLEWLQPENSKSYFSTDCEFRPHVPQNLKDDKASIWLYRSLENHSLSQKLSWLLSDKTHLLKCYQEYAFLCQGKYAEAALICVRAVERNQASLMSEINPCLFLLEANAKEFHKLHRRCSSYPDDYLKNMYVANEKKHSRTVQNLSVALKEQNQLDSTPTKNKSIKGKLKPWHSMPSLRSDSFKIKSKEMFTLSKTTPSTPLYSKKISTSALKIDYKSMQHPKLRKSNLKKNFSKTKKETRHVIINNCDIIEHTPPLSSSQSSGAMVNDDLMNLSTKSLPETRTLTHSPRLVDSFLPLPGEKDFRKTPKKSFIEDGGMSVLPMATGYFPRPMKGQSLLSFLTSSQFARANAELDRENAHFSISEAIISAMEQIKCRRDIKLTDEQLDDSDPEILDLKQRIRLRRREKLVEKQRKAWAESLMSDGKTDTATTVSPCSTTPDSLSDCASSDEVDDLEIDDASNLSDNHGLSVSMASLYSEADVLKRPRGAPDGASDIFSAEGVALSLISKFSEKQLPRASDLEWLVSEEDAPQALLPMPKSWPVSPDDSEISASMLLRGTQEWAPPRPQIIFTIHPPPSRKVLMTKQNYRCAGCSMKVAPQYASRFRYCDYLGRYFCTGCHTNQLALIPGRVLQKWDFTRLLEQMYSDPLFRVFELNKHICKMSRNLQFCRKLRLGLFYLKDFIFACRYAEMISETLEKEKSYILTDPEVYSMEDLVSVRNGDMKLKLKYLVESCCRHTSECRLCLARGFICEICNAPEVIFPWQMRRVRRCSQCGMCYHANCWNPNEKPCQKC
ncbi:run domain Beclin-1 interacting and cysteine-rich containing protein, partial [Asbolus verrucosus]